MKKRIKIERTENVHAFDKYMNEAFNNISDINVAELYSCLALLAFNISRNVLDSKMSEIYGAEDIVQDVVKWSIAYGGLGAWAAAKDAFPDVDVNCVSVEKFSDGDFCYFTVE